MQENTVNQGVREARTHTTGGTRDRACPGTTITPGTTSPPLHHHRISAIFFVLREAFDSAVNFALIRYFDERVIVRYRRYTTVLRFIDSCERDGYCS